MQGKTFGSHDLKWLQLGRYSKNLWMPPCLLDNIVSEIQRIVLNMCIPSSSEFFLDSPFKVFDKLYLHIKIKYFALCRQIAQCVYFLMKIGKFKSLYLPLNEEHKCLDVNKLQRKKSVVGKDSGHVQNVNIYKYQRGLHVSAPAWSAFIGRACKGRQS